jgi:hypothetical protein
MTYYILFILSNNSFNEFGVDRKVCVNLESAYRIGQNILGAENVYGYVITKHDQDFWSIVSETVYGCEYTVFEHNGRIGIHEGRDQYVIL